MNPQAISLVIARILLAVIFVVSGFGKFANLAGTAGYIASAGLPLPQVLAITAAALEVIGGVLLIVGWPVSRWSQACCSTTSGPCRPSSNSCSS
jgi:putative oxidoreductase